MPLPRSIATPPKADGSAAKAAAQSRLEGIGVEVEGLEVRARSMFQGRHDRHDALKTLTGPGLDARSRVRHAAMTGILDVCRLPRRVFEHSAQLGAAGGGGRDAHLTGGAVADGTGRSSRRCRSRCQPVACGNSTTAARRQQRCARIFCSDGACGWPGPRSCQFGAAGDGAQRLLLAREISWVCCMVVNGGELKHVGHRATCALKSCAHASPGT